MKGIGTDIIEVERIKSSIAEYGTHFLKRHFTEEEIDYCSSFKRDPEVHFAGRFCAKEAVVKALGTGFTEELGFLDIEIKNDCSGKPSVLFKQKKDQQKEVLISISHCRSFATAVAIWVR